MVGRLVDPTVGADIANQPVLKGEDESGIRRDVLLCATSVPERFAVNTS